MSNPYVRLISSIPDIDGRILKVGIDYDSVTIGDYRLDGPMLEHFGRAFVAACWEASRNGAPDGV